MPLSAQDYFENAVMMMQQGRQVDAINTLQACLMTKPDHHQAWCNRAILLTQLGNTFDAILNYNQALSYHHDAEYFHNRGVAWADLLRYEAAESDYLTALKMDPKQVNSYQMLGGLYIAQDRMNDALMYFTKGRLIDPNHTGCQLGLAIAQLGLGMLKDGFKNFESRWDCGQIPKRGLDVPTWEGEDLNGKTLMIYHEQGHGDTLQFIRYAAEIKKLWPEATIKAEVRFPLMRLIRTVPGVDEVIPYGEDHGHIDYGCAIISCARVMGTTMETIPAPQSYMRASAHLSQRWRRELDGDLKNLAPHKKVGICWAGGRRPFQPLANSIDKRRSTELHQWAPLAEVPGVIFVSLMADQELANQIKTQRPPAMTLIWPGRGGEIEPFEDFADTAALIDNLDLVISVDTAVMHVAAALGKPTWMLSRYDGCWRWFGNRPDSPWYPTLRQFRQPSAGDWAAVFKKVARELGKWAAADQQREAAE